MDGQVSQKAEIADPAARIASLLAAQKAAWAADVTPSHATRDDRLVPEDMLHLGGVTRLAHIDGLVQRQRALGAVGAGVGFHPFDLVAQKAARGVDLLDGQLDALKVAGAERIFADKITGTARSRPLRGWRWCARSATMPRPRSSRFTARPPWLRAAPAIPRSAGWPGSCRP